MDDPHHAEGLFIDVGTRIRSLREARGISMRELSRLSGISPNALSMIERAKTSPSVSTLYKLADALEVPITAFFRRMQQEREIVFTKARERPSVSFEDGIWEGLGGESFSGRVEPFMLALNPRGSSGEFGMVHTGHEFVLCLAGQLEYEVEGQIFVLEPGDSLLFAARLSHRWRNLSAQETRAVIVISGYESTERPSEYHLQGLR